MFKSLTGLNASKRTRDLNDQLQEARENNEPTVGLFLKLLYSDLSDRPTEWYEPDSGEYITWDDWADIWARNDILDEDTTRFAVSLIKESRLVDTILSSTVVTRKKEARRIRERPQV